MARGAEAGSVYRLFKEAKLGAGEWEGGCTAETGVLGNTVLKMRKAWECFVHFRDDVGDQLGRRGVRAGP